MESELIEDVTISRRAQNVHDMGQQMPSNYTSIGGSKPDHFYSVRIDEDPDELRDSNASKETRKLTIKIPELESETGESKQSQRLPNLVIDKSPVSIENLQFRFDKKEANQIQEMVEDDEDVNRHIFDFNDQENTPKNVQIRNFKDNQFGSGCEDDQEDADSRKDFSGSMGISWGNQSREQDVREETINEGDFKVFYTLANKEEKGEADEPDMISSSPKRKRPKKTFTLNSMSREDSKGFSSGHTQSGLEAERVDVKRSIKLGEIHSKMQKAQEEQDMRLWESTESERTNREMSIVEMIHSRVNQSPEKAARRSYKFSEIFRLLTVCKKVYSFREQVLKHLLAEVSDLSQKVRGLLYRGIIRDQFKRGRLLEFDQKSYTVLSECEVDRPIYDKFSKKQLFKQRLKGNLFQSTKQKESDLEHAKPIKSLDPKMTAKPIDFEADLKEKQKHKNVFLESSLSESGEQSISLSTIREMPSHRETHRDSRVGSNVMDPESLKSSLVQNIPERTDSQSLNVSKKKGHLESLFLKKPFGKSIQEFSQPSVEFSGKSREART